jgi:integrase
MAKAARREHLTPARLRAEPLPEKGKTVIYDDDVRRLAVFIYPSGLRALKFIYHWRGKTETLDFGQMSLDEARKLGFEYSTMVEKGQDPKAKVLAEKRVGSFAELVDIWFADYAEENLRSFPQFRTWLGPRYVPKWFNEMKVNEITRRHVKDVIFPLAVRMRPTARQVKASMRMVFQWGIDEEEMLQSNPCSRLRHRGKRQEKIKPRNRFLSPDEIAKFYRAFDKHGRAGVALKVLLLTGQRPGEVAAMNWAHIREGWWELPGDPDPDLSWPGTKNGEDHWVWIPAAAMELIENYSHVNNVQHAGRGHNSPLVFSPHPRRLAYAMRRAMAKICKELGVVRATPHDLRRTHGTTTCELLGFEGRAAMNRIQNHVEGGISSVYDQHSYANETRQVMERVAKEIMRIVEGREEQNVIVASFVQGRT